MRILKSKKGFDYAILFMVVVLICLGFLFWQLNQKDKSFEKDIGDIQIGLAQTQQGADNMLFYLDQSAKYSAYEAAAMLGQQGGYINPNAACGKVIDGSYAAWNTCQDYKNICFPNVFNNFKQIFNDKLSKNYLESYNQASPGADFIKDNYLFAIHNKKVTGTAIQNIEMNIAPPQSKNAQYSAGRYAFKPSFSIDFPYDFNRYFELEKLANSIVSNCANKFTTFADINACAESNFAQWPDKPILKQSKTAKYITIALSKPQFISPYTGKNMTVQFALCIPHMVPTP
ncbi:hypothetical protein KY333_04695 [Candidatus Woesearchaeota archaeon]|nr:hypothetical protein [Candidatus Woesearchaeota archaeon]MBW2994190.1 hypothetical protein [Candidatus Woesearchaeota archaeon]